jgi:translation initiation factor 2B subunit (eIF-2B alpha/beta/delta family)
VYWIEEIGREGTAGAHEVAMRCAAHLTGVCRTASGGQGFSLLARLTDIGIQLVRAKPSLAPIINLVNGLLLHVQQVASSGADSEEIRREALAFLEAFQKSSSKSVDEVAARAVPLLEQGSTVLTVSGSETVARTLEEAHRVGVLSEVVVAESRPLMEGKLVARRLGARGICVTLIVDAAVGLLAHRCDVLLVGADAVGSDSFVNKIGTWCAVKAAKEAGKPRYALATETKLVPPGWPFPATEGESREVLAESWANVTALNPYFERVSLREVTGVVMENGVYPGSGIGRKTVELRLTPLLRPALAGVPAS